MHTQRFKVTRSRVAMRYEMMRLHTRGSVNRIALLLCLVRFGQCPTGAGDRQLRWPPRLFWYVEATFSTKLSSGDLVL